MLPKFEIINKLPDSLRFICGSEGEFHYRKIRNEHPEMGCVEQVIIEEPDGTCTFYHGHWPDHPGIKSLENAKIVADSKAEYWLSFKPCDD